MATTIFISPSPPTTTNQTSSSSMAITNLCPDSPRISFSYNLDHNPSSSSSSDQITRSDQNLSSSDFDFDFCLPCELGLEFSPADELFFNGVILPTHIKQTSPNPSIPLEEASRRPDEADTTELIVEVTSSTKASLIREEKGSSNSNSRSFWRFMRSSSLNSDNDYSHCKKASIWSSLPLLARSYSTGLRHSSSKKKKAQFGKATGNSSNPGVLNVPPLYITKGTSDLLGFGSLFRNGNDKKNKKP